MHSIKVCSKDIQYITHVPFLKFSLHVNKLNQVTEHYRIILYILQMVMDGTEHCPQQATNSRVPYW